MLISDRLNVSLVAFYGTKPLDFIKLILDLQKYLQTSQLVAGGFIGYQLEQIHGTIIGCEGLRTERGIISKWFYESKNETRYIDLANLIKYLNCCPSLPLKIRFGGYDRHKDYGFLSRGLHPFERSFQLQSLSDGTIVPVLMGWSLLDNRITLEIDDLRRSFQQFNLLHKYHQKPDAIDNDFYLRLGTIEGKISTKDKNKIETDIREILSKQAVDLVLDKNNLAFAQYRDLSLTLETTKILPVTESNLEKLKELY
ncbi:MAG: hypothetical protein ACFCU5_16400 [Pleurocapsa sp.]